MTCHLCAAPILPMSPMFYRGEWVMGVFRYLIGCESCYVDRREALVALPGRVR